MSKMKKITAAVTLMGLLAFGVALAQMGPGGHDHGTSGNHDGSMEYGQMNMMDGMSKRHTQIMATFDELDEHFQSMMAVSDIKLLRSYMVDHRILMSQMRDHMVSQQTGWQQMMPSPTHTQQMSHKTKTSGTGCSTSSQSGCGN